MWRVLAGVVLAAAGLALGWLWFRDSSFAAVERVTVTGSGSSEHVEVERALQSAAKGMSTLHVDRGALKDAVSSFSSVADLRVRADFPHDLNVEVIEHEPVATVQAGGAQVPATGGGLLLEGVHAEDLPVVDLRGPLAGDRVSDPRTLAALQIAAAAPAALRERATRLYFGKGGMRLDLRNGPELVFGSAADARTKWQAAARVLGESSAAGATYLDLRVPTLVAAGGVGPIEPEPTPTPGTLPMNPQPQG
jgi:cell division protein FtsQ